MTVESFLEHRGFTRHADGFVRCACSAKLGPQHMSMMGAEQNWIAHLRAIDAAIEKSNASLERTRNEMKRIPGEVARIMALLCDCGSPRHAGVSCRFAKKFMVMAAANASARKGRS